MRQIRYSTFETNSSSTHTLIIMTEDEYEKLCDEELYINFWGGCNDSLIQKDQVDFKTSHYDCDGYESQEECRRDLGIYTLDEWSDDEYLEYDEHRYTSPSGDKIVAIAKYGRDG